MPVKRDASGRRSVQAEVEVPGSPEEVWQAIATGPGISSWFVPTEFEEQDGKPVAVKMNFGPGMESRAVLTAWDPPRRLGWEHEAERLDGKPAPRFAAETHFTIDLELVDAATRVRLTSRQVPASRPRGLVIRLFGSREIGGKLDGSLERLAKLVA